MVKFISFASALLSTAVLSSSAQQLVLHNGQNITWDYSDSIVPAGSLFGMGCLRTGAAIPETIVSDGWEGPVISNINDQDVIPATYVLQYPFFQNGSSYTAQIFQYDTATLQVVVPNVHNTTFIWVNRPGELV